MTRTRTTTRISIGRTLFRIQDQDCRDLSAFLSMAAFLLVPTALPSRRCRSTITITIAMAIREQNRHHASQQFDIVPLQGVSSGDHRVCGMVRGQHRSRQRPERDTCVLFQDVSKSTQNREWRWSANLPFFDLVLSEADVQTGIVQSGGRL